MQFERLEPRQLLAADPLASAAFDYHEAQPAWFARVDLTQQTEIAPGPIQTADYEWIVRLTPEATATVHSVDQVAEVLSGADVGFTITRGLGVPGLVLATAQATSFQASESALRNHPAVATFSNNATVAGAQVPNDLDLQSTPLVGLNNEGLFDGIAGADIDAAEAWDITTGSRSVVVGIIDSGIDAAHVDLYQNVWLNQGEIPTELRGGVLTDSDDDGLITFVDLNDDANSIFVVDLNNNGYIDALDLLDDPNWADGLDTDRNGFVDDIFGWNFRRAADEPFIANNPSDTLGHGTHIAGTIGAVGNNDTGVVGVNWEVSLMALKFLDETNQGNPADAIEALNYARMMRTRFNTDIRVTNNSWGQPGSPNRALEEAIAANGDAGILFVAAAGNGDLAGQGIDNDDSPFFPASFDLPNVISVAASDSRDNLARFSNFGDESVDIAAPGVGIISTLPGNEYGVANGTSMAAPHVSGTIALLYSLLPGARLEEVRQAVLETAEGIGTNQLSTGGRVTAAGVLTSNVFAPSASLVSPVENVVTSGGTEVEIEVRFVDRTGVVTDTIGDGDVTVQRLWGPRDTISATLIEDPVVEPALPGQPVTTVARYRMAAPGGTFDPLDFGRYEVFIGDGAVVSQDGRPIPATRLGEFQVRIEEEGVLYVDSEADLVDVDPGDGDCVTIDGTCSLRAATQEAGAHPDDEFIIILESGRYELESFADPVVGIDLLATNEDTALSFSFDQLASNDTSDSGKLSLVGFDFVSRQGGSVFINPDGSASYFPPPEFFGLDEFDYQVSGGSTSVVNGRVVIDVLPVNDAPTALDDSFLVDRDTTTDLFVLDNDFDGFNETDPLTIVSVGVTAGGTIEISPDGLSLSYTPAPGFLGIETFDYQIADSGGLRADASVTVNVVDGLEPPVANDDFLSTPEDTNLAFDAAFLTQNDTDDAGILNVVSVTADGSIGTVMNMGGGQFLYVPNPDIAQVDLVRYTLSDGITTTQGTLVIDVLPVNDPPLGVDDVFTVTENSGSTILPVLANDLEGPGSELTENNSGLTVTGVTPSPGFQGSISVTSAGVISYVPATSFVGSDTFTYTVVDAGGLSAIATATIDVVDDDQFSELTVVVTANAEFTPFDTQPFLPTSSITTVAPGETFFVDVWARAELPEFEVDQILVDLFFDPGLVSAEVAVSSGPFADPAIATFDNMFGVVELIGGSSADPGVGLNQFTRIGFVEFTAISDQAVTIGADASDNISILRNSIDPLFTLPLDTSQIDTTSRVFLNQPTNAADDVAVTDEDVPVTIDVLANDFVVGTPSLSISSPPVNGTVMVNPDNTVTYTPNADFTGTDGFAYTLTGPQGSSTAFVTVNVQQIALFELELDIRQDGNSIVQTDGTFSVEVGDTFDLELLYTDGRTELQREGAFQVIADIIASDTSAFVPVLSETQTISFDNTLLSGTGPITVSAGTRSASDSFNNFANNPTATLAALIADVLQISLSELVVSQSNGIEGTDFQVRFTGARFELADVATLAVDVVGVNTPTIIETNVFLSDGSFNPAALRSSIDTRSRSLAGLDVYGERTSGEYTPASFETFNEVGGIGPFTTIADLSAANGVPFTGQRFEALSIPIRVTGPASNVSFSVDFAEDFDGILLYGQDDSVPQSEILIDLSPGGGGRVVGTFTGGAPGSGNLIAVSPRSSDDRSPQSSRLRTTTAPEGETDDQPALTYFIDNTSLVHRLELAEVDQTLVAIGTASDPGAGQFAMAGGVLFFTPDPNVSGEVTLTFTVAMDPVDPDDPNEPVVTVDRTLRLFITSPLTTQIGSVQSDDSQGALSIRGNVTIAADRSDRSVIFGDGIDRIFTVMPGASLELLRVGLTDGSAATNQDGGAILSAGTLTVFQSELVGNEAVKGSVLELADGGGGGGAIAIIGGQATLTQSSLVDNEAVAGGAIFVTSGATARIEGSTLARNAADVSLASDINDFNTSLTRKIGGGGILSLDGGLIDVVNSTLSGNEVVPFRGRTFSAVRSQFDFGSAIFNNQQTEFLPSQNAVQSADGRFVVYQSTGPVTPSDGNSFSDIFLLDRDNPGNPVLVSRNLVGRSGNNASTGPSISADGNLVTFESLATDLVPVDSNNASDIFVFNRTDGTVRRVSLSEAGAQASGGSQNAVISADGTFVAFESNANNLVSGDSNSLRDVFRVSLVSGQVDRVSQQGPVGGNGESGNPTINADASVIAFDSVSTNFDTDTNVARDVFVTQFAPDRTRSGPFLREGVSVNSGTGFQAEPDDSIPTANVVDISAGQTATITGVIGDGAFGNTTGDFDFFLIRDVGANQQITLDIDARTLTPSSGLDSVVVIYDAAGNQVALNDDFGGLDSFLQFTTSVPGDLYVLVTAFFNLPGDRFVPGSGSGRRSVGNYELSITLGAGDNSQPILSSDGSALAFVDGSRLQVFDAAGNSDVIELASFGLSPTSRFSPNSLIARPTFSADGNQIAVAIQSTNQPGQAFAEFTGVVVLDRAQQTVVAGSPSLPAGEFATLNPFISDDGSAVTFESRTRVTDDTVVGVLNVFTRDLASGVDTAVQARPFGAISLDHVTLVDNFGRETISGPVLTGNSLFAGNEGVSSTSDLGARSLSIGFNLFDTPTQSGTTNISDRTSPTARDNVGDLASSGGPTQTHPLLNRSQARNAADPASVQVLDQRNQLRGQGESAAKDIGAFEATGNVVSGSLFDDIDEDGRRDLAEGGIVGVTVFLDTNGNGAFDPGEPTTITTLDDEATLDVFEDGNFLFDNVQAGSYDVLPIVPGFTRTDRRIEMISVTEDGAPANQASGLVFGSGSEISISGDGRLVAFTSSATNLAGLDNNNATDIYLFDRVTGRVERISRGIDDGPANGASSHPSISDDGRFIVYQSNASNLVEGDTNGGTDVFLHDRINNTTVRVSQRSDGTESTTGNSSRPSISADGTTVVFQSTATDLSADDADASFDVFLFDRVTSKLQVVPGAAAGLNFEYVSAHVSGDGSRVVFESRDFSTNRKDIEVFDVGGNITQSVAGDLATDDSDREIVAPAISDDGRTVAFAAFASDLFGNDPDDDRLDAFFVELASPADVLAGNPIATDQPQRITVGLDGVPDTSTTLQELDPSISVSADGGLIAFASNRDNLVLDDRNQLSDIFLFNRDSGQIELAGKSESGQLGRGSGLDDTGSFGVDISADGAFIAFASSFENLLVADQNRLVDVFVTRNPDRELAPVRVEVSGNESFAGIEIGLVPLVGSIQGRVFEDISPNAAFDVGEELIEDVTVFLDENRNGRLDPFERFEVTDQTGFYRFEDVPGEVAYAIVAQEISGFTQVLPADGEAREVFLPGGANVTRRDFGFRVSTTAGQSNDASVTGMVFRDLNGNGVRDMNEEPVRGAVVFADLNGDGQLVLEPRTVTDENGVYILDGLRDVTQSIRVVPETATTQSAPRGSEFRSESISLRNRITADRQVRFSNIQDVVSGEFGGEFGGDADSPDFAVALFEANQVLIQLNQGDGTFGGTSLFLDVAPGGGGPIAMATAMLDDGDVQDLVVANDTTGNVSVFLNVATEGVDAVPTTVPVGSNPVDIETADFNADGNTDFAVVNQSLDRVTVMLGDGAGGFTDGGSFPTGTRPSSLAIADLDGNGSPDLAVTNLGNFRVTGTDGGNRGTVSVLFNDGDGGFTTGPTLVAGLSPVSIAVSDLDRDANPDLVVANLNGNTLSIFLGTGAAGFEKTEFDFAVGSRPIQVRTVDLEGDDDQDVVVTNLGAEAGGQGVSILRNLQSQRGFGFEPANNFGVAVSGSSTQFTFDIADLNDDDVPDLVVANTLTDEIQILTNELVDGVHRVDLSFGSLTGLDFGIKPAPFAPTLDPITSVGTNATEDAAVQSIALTGIQKGAADKPSPLVFTIETIENGALITDLSVVPSANGQTAAIRYRPVQDANGQAVLRLTVTDAGQDDEITTTIDNGQITRLITITVAAVNDPPVVTLERRVINVLEDAGTQTVDGFLQSVTPGGGPDEVATQTIIEQELGFDAAFFNLPPSFNADGDLTFEVSPNASGTTTVEVRVRDDGGLDGAGIDRTRELFVITVVGVNDAPSFTLDGDVNVTAGDQPIAVPDFATSLAPGADDENPQGVFQYNVTFDAADADKFRVPPAIDVDGTLTLQPSFTQFGDVTVSVVVVDTGGTDNGGQNASEPIDFRVRIAPPIRETLVVQGAGQVVDLSQLSDADLRRFETVDLRGDGDNTLMLAASRVLAHSPNRTLNVIADAGDQVMFDPNWSFDSIQVADGQFVRVFRQVDAIARLTGPSDWNNPLEKTDVTGRDGTTAVDALQVINELSRRRVSDDAGVLDDATSVDPALFRFFDVDGSGSVTSLDALQVINQLARISGRNNGPAGEQIAELIESLEVISRRPGTDQSLAVSDDSKPRAIASFDESQTDRRSDPADPFESSEKQTSEKQTSETDDVFADLGWLWD